MGCPANFSMLYLQSFTFNYDSNKNSQMLIMSHWSLRDVNISENESHLYCFSFLINISISSLLREMWCDGSVAESKEGCQYFQKVNIPIQAIGMCGKPQYWYCWSADITSIYCPMLKSSHDDESILIFLRIVERLWVNLTSSLTPLPWCCE